MEKKEERRSGKERRSGEGCRKFNDPNYKGLKRRSGLLFPQWKHRDMVLQGELQILLSR